MQTLLDIAKINADEGIVKMIEANIDSAPELQILPAFTIKGTSFRTLTRVSFPQGGFRNANEGLIPGKDEFSNQLVECFIYENPMEEDLAVAKAYRNGMAGYLARVADGRVKGALQKIGKQLWYGVNSPGDAKGHPGLLDSYDATNMTVDATGSSATTGSSVWFLKLGEENISFVFGQNSTLTIGEWMQQMLVSTTKRYMGVVNTIQAWVGIQVVNPKAAVRIKDCTEDSGKGLTDNLGYQALEKFPVGMTPDVVFMTKRSRRQLQVSRATITAAGGVYQSPLPTDICGIPIVVTDSLLNTETLT